MKNDLAKLAEYIFEKKRRRQLARLPFEKKIEIVVDLQKIAASIRLTIAAGAGLSEGAG